ncbi:MAG: hypothetical protein JXB14_00390 [Candidatus Altiarchaeota archaeon]|nr:hypothetical protein [Candidatus Altiarchaeota archaeon]
MSPRTKRKTRRGGKARRASRKTHHKRSKKQSTVGQYIQKLSRVTDLKRSLSSSYMSILSGRRATKPGRSKKEFMDELSRLLSEKERMLAGSDKKELHSAGGILAQQESVLKRLQNNLEPIYDSIGSGFKTQDKRKDNLIKNLEDSLREQNKSLSAVRRYLKSAQRRNTKRKFVRETLIVELLDSKINKEGILLKLVKEYSGKTKRATLATGGDHMVRDEIFIEELLRLLKEQRAILGHSRLDASKLGSIFLEEAVKIKLLRQEPALLVPATKDNIKEKVFMDLLSSKILAEKKLVRSLKNQLRNVKDEKVKQEIVKNIKEEVREIKSEEEPDLSRDEIFKKYRIKKPNTEFIDALMKMAEADEIKI